LAIRLLAPYVKVRNTSTGASSGWPVKTLIYTLDFTRPYYIELEDHRVLFLSGQYLYDHDAEDQPRTFPCSEFVVQRHRIKGYVVDIVCRGAVLEPEAIAPPFYVHDFDKDVPKDGEIIAGKPYDRLKNERMANLRSPAQ